MVDQETYDYVQQLERELQEAEKDRRNIATAQLGMYESQSQEDNLVKWQLNLEEEKDRIYHLLKGHRKGINEKGEEVWMPADSDDSVILNNYGVDYVMGLLESFMNRNIILSNFDEDRMKEICLDLSDQIINDIYNDYERMGLNTDDKRKKFGIIVWKVMINIEAALRRAMDNGERRSLRAIMTINQTDNPMRNNMNYPVMQPTTSRRKLFHPSTW